MRENWLLEPDVTFLNHGSFGACPRPVLALQDELRARLEREPMRFFLRDLGPLLDEARAEVAAFVGARSDNVVFVRNASSGVNAVLRSLRFEPGDELLTTDHTYAACRNVLEYVAARAQAKVIVAPVPFPLASPDEVTSAIARACTARTRLLLVDHVTSPTGLVFPLEPIVREAEGRGIAVLVDGAHGPGMVPLALESLGASWYVANFHKWTCAPKGAGLLFARGDRQADLHPVSISHGYASRRPRSRFAEEFDWTGTDDPTPWLCVPAAIRFVGGLVPGGWEEVRRRNRALVLRAREILCQALGIAAPAPESMIGSLAAIPLPAGTGAALSGLDLDPLQRALYDRHRIEAPIPPWPAPPARLIRVSAHLYNHEAEYERLADALRQELAA